MQIIYWLLLALMIVGIIGAVVPAIGGPLLGILFGPLLGAIIAEYIYCRQLRLSIKAGIEVLSLVQLSGI
jgi:uncharacterized protein YqgC (DUF456 family)